MIINKIYESISGEVGTVIPQGYPCLIIRTQGCNLKCHYCDAPETQSFKEGGTHYTTMELIGIIKRYDLPVLLTGGEPLAQKDCATFLRTCAENSIPVQVETNGTIKLPDVDESIGFIVDYKNGNQFAINFFSDLTPNDYVKFVVENMDDLYEVCSIINETIECSANWAISPVHGIEGSILPRQVSKYIIKNKIPAVLNIQLHKLIYMP